MSLTLEQSDIFLDSLLHPRQESTPPASTRRRRTVSHGFEEMKARRGFLDERRTRSYGQDVAKLPETIIRKQETFTSIPEEEKEKEEGSRWSWQKVEAIPGLGIILSLVTVIIYQCGNVIAKKMPVNTFVMILWREVFLAPQYAPPIIYNGQNPFPRKKLPLLAIRAIGDALNMMANFYALNVLPLGDVMMIASIRVIIVNLFSCIFLKEPCGVFEIANIFIVLGGILLVIQPPAVFGSASDSGYTDEMVYVALTMLVTNTISSLGVVVVRHLRELHWAVLGVNNRAFCLAEALLACWLTGNLCIPDCGWDRLSILALALIGFVSSSTFILALKYEAAGVIGLTDNATHVILSQIFQVVIFSEVPGPLKVVGILLVLSAIIGVGIRSIVRSRRRRKQKITFKL